MQNLQQQQKLLAFQLTISWLKMPQLSVECIKCIDIMKSHISKEDGKKTVLIYQNSIVLANLNSLYGMLNGQ